MIIAGIGSRKTPQEVLDIFESFARKVSAGKNGYGAWIRSGHADGADYAFEKGAREKCIVYLPWDSFNHDKPILGKASALNFIDEDAFNIVLEHEPHAVSCSNGVKLLKCRNVYQVLGRDMCSHSDLVVCWTPGGTNSGGTGLAVKIARDYNIPVIDMGQYPTPVITEKLLWDIIEKNYPHIWSSIPHETIQE